jgi:hypothetical protein
MRVRLILAVALAAVALLPVAPSASSQAVGASEAPTLTGYDVQGRASGLVFAYDIPGRLPLSPLFDIAVPDAQSSVAVGPSSSAAASLGYPGPLLLSLDTVLAQFGGVDNPLPPYPLIVRAPTAAGSSIVDTTSLPGGQMEAKAEGAVSRARAILPAKTALPVLDLGTIDAVSDTSVAGNIATGHVRVQVDGVAIPGLLSIEALVTDLKVTSDGTKTTQEASTKAVGVRILGREAIIDGDGVRFTAAAQDDVAELLKPIVDGLGPLLGGLGPVLDGLGPLTAGVNAIISGAPTGLQQVLDEVGISIRLAESRVTADGGTATLDGAGVLVSFDQELNETPLAQLLDLLPPVPDIPGLPLQVTDLLAILRANHLGSLGFASGRVVVSAKGPRDASSSGGGTSSFPDLGGSDVAFDPIQPPGFDSAPGAATPDARPAAFNLPLGSLVGWRMVLLGIALALVASAFTRRLPDLALAAAQAGPCTPTQTKGRSS